MSVDASSGCWDTFRMPQLEETLGSVEALNLTLVRFLPDDRYALMSSDEQELAVLSHKVPGVASVRGRAVQLTAERRNRRLAVVASNEPEELGWIQLSWIPGRHRIRVGDSEFRAARRLFRGGWTLYGQSVHLATLELNGWSSPSLGLTGRNQIDAGRVAVKARRVLEPDMLLALVLLFEMLAYDSIPVPAAGPGG
jgi:hypothetical protein